MIIYNIYYISIILIVLVFLCRQSKGVHTVEEMQLLRDRANYLEKKVMKYEQEIQALRSDLDMLVYLHTT